MNRTELRREFEIEYRLRRIKPGIPFYELFESNKNFEEYLFEDFLKCEKTPCARLYNRIYFSGTEYQESLNQSRFDTETGVLTDSGDGAPVAAITNAPSEYSKLLRKSCIEFENLRRQNEIPEIYFMHDLSQSKILKILNRVQELISDTQMYLSRSTHEPYMLDLVDSRCKEILSLLESLNHSDLKKAVLTSMINEDCSIFIANDIKLGTIELVSGEKPDYVKWNIAKDRIKQILKNNLQSDNNHLHQLQSGEEVKQDGIIRFSYLETWWNEENKIYLKKGLERLEKEIHLSDEKRCTQGLFAAVCYHLYYEAKCGTNAKNYIHKLDFNPFLKNMTKCFGRTKPPKYRQAKAKEKFYDLDINIRTKIEKAF